MKNNFLVNEGVNKQRFNSFELEKIKSDHTLTIKITAQPDIFTIIINQSEKLMLLTFEPFIGDFNMQAENEKEEYSFLLPDFIEVGNYFQMNGEHETYLIFQKTFKDKSVAYYY